LPGVYGLMQRPIADSFEIHGLESGISQLNSKAMWGSKEIEMENESADSTVHHQFKDVTSRQ